MRILVILALAVGFQIVQVPNGSKPAITTGIWYPTSSQPHPSRLEFFTQNVAVDGAIRGDALPLVLISHGVLGSMASHYDTAIALARAGFVVAAPTMSGDSWPDHRLIGTTEDLRDRPLEMTAVLNYLLHTWSQRTHINGKQIGMYGHSLGAFTALVLAGGKPNVNLTADLCRSNPSAPECAFIRQYGGDPLHRSSIPIQWTADARIRSIVIAAPALGFMFSHDGLANVHVPVELWIARDDTISPNAWNGSLIASNLSRRTEVHTVAAGHLAFRAPCNATARRLAAIICSDPLGFDRTAFHAAFNRELITFFKRTIANYTAKAVASSKI